MGGGNLHLKEMPPKVISNILICDASTLIYDASKKRTKKSSNVLFRRNPSNSSIWGSMEGEAGVLNSLKLNA